MKAVFEGTKIKVWFSSQSTSRNFYNVVEIVQEGNAVLIKTGNGDQHLLNWDNINLVEEIEGESLDRKMLELKEKFKKQEGVNGIIS